MITNTIWHKVTEQKNFKLNQQKVEHSSSSIQLHHSLTLSSALNHLNKHLERQFFFFFTAAAAEMITNLNILTKNSPFVTSNGKTNMYWNDKKQTNKKLINWPQALRLRTFFWNWIWQKKKQTRNMEKKRLYFLAILIFLIINNFVVSCSLGVDDGTDERIIKLCWR